MGLLLVHMCVPNAHIPCTFPTYNLSAWSLELGAWSLELGAWSLEGKALAFELFGEVEPGVLQFFHLGFQGAKFIIQG